MVLMSGKFRVISWGSQSHEMESGGLLLELRRKTSGQTRCYTSAAAQNRTLEEQGSILIIQTDTEVEHVANKEPHSGQGYFWGRNRKFILLGERIKLLRKAFSEET